MTGRPLVIIGAGGFGREAADVVTAINAVAEEPAWDFIGTHDDSPSKDNLDRLTARGIAFLGPIPTQCTDEEKYFVAGIGNPKVRQMVSMRMEDMGWTPATLIHPDAVIGTKPKVGQGTVVCGGVQLSTNVQLGRHVHVNPNVTIGHDAQLDDYVSVNPAAVVSGEVRVRERVLLGANCTVLQGLSIGTDVTVGAAACVVQDVAQDSVVKGVPAR